MGFHVGFLYTFFGILSFLPQYLVFFVKKGKKSTEVKETGEVRRACPRVHHHFCKNTHAS